MATTAFYNAHASANKKAEAYIVSRTGWQAAIIGVSWSYTDDPTTLPATLTVYNGNNDQGQTVLTKWYITKGGPGFILLPKPLKADSGNDMIIRLSPGGAGIYSSVQVTPD